MRAIGGEHRIPRQAGKEAFIACGAEHAIISAAIDSLAEIAVFEARKRYVLFSIRALSGFIDQQFEVVAGHEFRARQGFFKTLAVLTCDTGRLQQRTQTLTRLRRNDDLVNLRPSSGSRFGEADIDGSAALQFLLRPFRQGFLCRNPAAQRVVGSGPLRLFKVEHHMLIGVKACVAVLDALSDIDTARYGAGRVADHCRRQARLLRRGVALNQRCRIDHDGLSSVATTHQPPRREQKPTTGDGSGSQQRQTEAHMRMEGETDLPEWLQALGGKRLALQGGAEGCKLTLRRRSNLSLACWR